MIARGVNMTTPPLSCHPNPTQTFQLHKYLQHLGIHFEARHAVPASASLASEAAFAKKFDAFMKATSESCVKHGDQAVLRSVTTSLVAQDMKTILERVGDAERGLVYWGKSYGSILGATFAA